MQTLSRTPATEGAAGWGCVWQGGAIAASCVLLRRLPGVNPMLNRVLCELEDRVTVWQVVLLWLWSDLETMFGKNSSPIASYDLAEMFPQALSEVEECRARGHDHIVEGHAPSWGLLMKENGEKYPLKMENMKISKISKPVWEDGGKLMVKASLCVCVYSSLGKLGDWKMRR